MNVIKKSLVGLTALVLLGSASLATAAPMETSKSSPKKVALTDAQKAEMAKKHVERRYADLNLSASQLKKIEAIEAQYRSTPVAQTRDLKQEALKNRLQQLNQERLTLIQNKSFNEANAQKWIQEEQQVQQQMQLDRSQKMAAHRLNQMRKEHAVFQVLDKKQQQAYLERANKPHPMNVAHKKDGKPGDKHHHGKQHAHHHGHEKAKPSSK